MPSARKKTTKDGKIFYEIRVSRGRGKSYLSKRWYVPEGWSKKAIDREVAKVAADFERKVKAGEIVSKSEQKQLDEIEAAEALKVQTVKQYGERVFMPGIKLRATENTRASYQGIFDRWIYPTLGNVKLPEVTPAAISAFLLHMQSKGLAHGSVIKTYSILATMFKQAYLTDMIEKNPMDKVGRPKPRKEERAAKVAEAYTAKEVSFILSCLKNEPLKWRCFVCVLIDTGIRRGECCGLQWKDIDFSCNTAIICRNLCYTKEKGVYIDTPKNGKSRVVYLGADTIALLQELRKQQAERAISAYVFTQEGAPAPMHPTSVTHYFRCFGKKYNVPGFHPHKLRHTFASVAITAGADVASISEALGHSDKSVTLRMYTHADQESRKIASSIFRDAIKKADLD